MLKFAYNDKDDERGIKKKEIINMFSCNQCHFSLVSTDVFCTSHWHISALLSDYT